MQISCVAQKVTLVHPVSFVACSRQDPLYRRAPCVQRILTFQLVLILEQQSCQIESVIVASLRLDDECEMSSNGMYPSLAHSAVVATAFKILLFPA
jgi:hypothetical protein